MEKANYVKKQENGDFLLIPCELSNKDAPNGIKITPVTLSRMGFAIKWFYDFLEGTKDIDDYPIEGSKYQALRNSSNVYLQDVRDGGKVSIVGFSPGEIQNVLKEIEEILKT